MSVVRLGAGARTTVGPRRIVLDAARYALVRSSLRGLELPPPFDHVPDPGVLPADELARGRADLRAAGVLRGPDDELHPAVAASLLAHAAPDLRLDVDVHHGGAVGILRGAVSGLLTSTLCVVGDRILLTTAAVDDLVPQVRDLLGAIIGTGSRGGREPGTVSARVSTPDHPPAVLTVGVRPDGVDRVAEILTAALTRRLVGARRG